MGKNMGEGKKILVTTGITLAVYFVLRYLLPYVIPFLFAYLLVHLLNPVTEAIRKKLPWKKEIIVSVLLVILLSLLTFLFYYFYCMLMSQIRKIAMNFDYYYSCFCGWVDGCCHMAEKSFGIRVDTLRELVYSSLDQATEQIRVYIVPGVVNYSVRYFKKVMDAGLFLLMLFVAVILLMKEDDGKAAELQDLHAHPQYYGPDVEAGRNVHEGPVHDHRRDHPAVHRRAVGAWKPVFSGARDRNRNDGRAPLRRDGDGPDPPGGFSALPPQAAPGRRISRPVSPDLYRAGISGAEADRAEAWHLSVRHDRGGVRRPVPLRPCRGPSRPGHTAHGHRNPA